MHLLSLSITVHQKQKNSLNFSVFSLKVFSLFINKGGITEIFLELKVFLLWTNMLLHLLKNHLDLFDNFK